MDPQKLQALTRVLGRSISALSRLGELAGAIAADLREVGEICDSISDDLEPGLSAGQNN